MESATEQQNVTVLVSSYEGLAELGADRIEELRALHEAEMVKVSGKISAAFAIPDSGPYRNKLARVAAVLRLHLEWIKRDIARRDKLARKAETAAKHSITLQRMADEREARKRKEQERRNGEALAAQERKERDARKLATVAAANDENARQIGVFKSVCREVLGDEMYSHIWQLTCIRIAAATKETAGA